MSQSADSATDFVSTAATEVTEPADEDTPVELPAGFVENFLWFPPVNSKDPSGTINPDPSDEFTEPARFQSPDTYLLPDSLIQDIQATASCAFSLATQNRNEEDTPQDKSRHSHREQCFILRCPYEGGHDFIDNVVKSIACQQKADVVVLDALELALGKFGALGKGVAQAIDEIYKSYWDKIITTSTLDTPKESTDSPEALKKKADEEAADKRQQKVFKALLRVQRKVPDDLEDLDSMEKVRRRIVYLRDFGSIARTAIPFVGHLLRALEPDPESTSKCKPQPTIIVAGVVEPQKAPKPSTPQDGSTPSLPLPFLGSLSNAFFRREPSDTDSSQSSPFDGPPGLFHTTVSNLFFGSASIYVLPQGFDADKEAQHRLTHRRSKIVQSALLVLCLGKKGAIFDGNPLDTTCHGFNAVSKGKITPIGEAADAGKNIINGLEDLGSTVATPEIVDRIATIAIGLANLSLPPNSSTPLRVTPGNVSEACQTYLKSSKMYSDWAELESKGKTATKKHLDALVEEVKAAKDLSHFELDLLNCIVDPSVFEISLEDVCIAPAIIESLKSIVSLPLLYPLAFKSGILAREAINGVLLYGPPGTGKTMVCRALAREMGVRMLQVKGSDILNKWVGESEKIVNALFSLASRLGPCVIFLDEIDALLSKRTSKYAPWHAQILAEFMQEMDGLRSAGRNKEKGIFIVGATNRPFDLDDAILRRLPARMLVDLPGEQEREQIIRVHLKGEEIHTEVDIPELARNTAQYSGSDLKNFCVSAALASLKEAIGTDYWRLSQKTRGADAEPPDFGTGEKSYATRVIAPAHFKHALGEVRPSWSQATSTELYNWHKSYSTGTLQHRNLSVNGVTRPYMDVKRVPWSPSTGKS